ncbi:hypothetical protein HAALTHF_37960n [Vreelandella aquamarina]|nr:hypothetical protein HAALTHF_37960n [Halomonas axialensis]
MRLENVDPSLFVPQLAGNLSGDIVAGVRQRGERWDISLPELDIQGQLQEYPLTLQASLEANSELEVDIEELLFTQGDNRLTASGQLSQEAMSLEANIALNQLQSLHPDLAGTLTGDIQAQGSFSRPEVVVELNGRSLRFAENRLTTLSLSVMSRVLTTPISISNWICKALMQVGKRSRRSPLTSPGDFPSMPCNSVPQAKPITF